MALPGELNGLVPEIKCPDCQSILPLQVALSGGGYYLGFVCRQCGPISRETDYFDGLTPAREALQKVKEGGSIPEERQ